MHKDESHFLDHDANCIGELCNACNEEFQAGDEVVLCPRCKQAHHAPCWQTHGGCTRLGCAQLASSAPEDKKRITDDDRAKQYSRPLPGWVPWALTVLGLFIIIGIPILQNTVFADKRPKLTVMIPALPDQAIIEQVAQEFGDLHPDLHVRVIASPYGQSGSLYEQKLSTVIAARDAPDIFVLPWARFMIFAEQGVYADLSPWIEQGPAALAELPQERLERGQVNGTWFGVPHPGRSAFFGIFRNSERIDEALDLLDRIISSIPVDEDVYDEYRLEPYIPQMRFFPGF